MQQQSGSIGKQHKTKQVAVATADSTVPAVTKKEYKTKNR